MSGMAMLLKSMGINFDPEQMMKDYDQLKQDLAMWGKVAIHLGEQFDRIEKQNTEILSILKPEKKEIEDGTERQAGSGNPEGNSSAVVHAPPRKYAGGN